MARSKKEQYDQLRALISQWNDDHYDIFELSLPNSETLEFHGVVRFFFQGAVGAKVITKCIRVSSTATTREVIDVLIEKFRPDMRMLSQNKYALYEVHSSGEERRLLDDEQPLYVQLNWGPEVREGRFLLRNEDHPTVRDPALGFDKHVLQQEQPNFKRKLSKREKKEKKKREKEMRGKENEDQDQGVANKLYSEAPDNSFTRSISNPEAVMRRRRQQKLEKKLAQMNAAEGGTDSGGTLKIYGESVRPDVPYKTLFLSTADPASAVVREAMEKYGLEKEDPALYCLVEVLLPPGGMEYHGGSVGDERVLDDNECPLAIVMQHAKHRGQGHIIFQLRQRAADYKKRSKRARAVSQDDLRNHSSDQRHTNVDMLPYLVELNVRGKPKKHILPLNVTEVVNVTEVANNRTDYTGKHFMQLSGPDIRPRHCVIAHTEGIVTVTPNSQDAETYVERQRIYETTMLKHGMMVQFGKERLYRFLDPRFDEPPMPEQQQPYQLPHKPPQHRGGPQETNFDLDGHIETSPPIAMQYETEPQRRTGVPKQNRESYHQPPVAPSEDLLPASVEYFLEDAERLLQASILVVNSKQLQFKLAPTYTLYMAVRHLLRARSPQGQKMQLIAEFVSKTAKMTQQAIQEQHNDPPSLAFWMANSSEILHMYKQDVDVAPASAECQEMLAEAVQMAFHHLVRCLQGDLQRVMPAFLDAAEDGDEEGGQRYNMGRPTLNDVLNTLSAAMTLLRRCRVNAALTIQLFSQLFHFINMWLFNILVTEPQLNLCTRSWGLRLKRRLGNVEAWAEKQGLELAADCHLCRIIQAAHLLQAPKATADDITNISTTCFKLNSMQVQALLTGYINEPDEPPVSPTFIERVVSIAENMADELTRTDGREVRLEEDPDLHLPFLLPEDGYTCDTIRGVPNGLPEFVGQLEAGGICRFSINNNASGSWTVYMGDLHSPSIHEGPAPGLPPTPEIMTLSLNKDKGSLGLSIIAATGEGQSEQGIYIKSVVEGRAAALDGRLKTGDQLLEVDGKSLLGLSQDKAAELMTKTGQVVRLKVAKQAALYCNLSNILQPSPTMQRADTNRNAAPNRMMNDDGPPPPYDGRDSKGMPYGQEINRGPPLGDPRVNDAYQRREAQDPRSKSTSNLHVDTNLGHNDMSMKPAQSVGMLHASAGYDQYSPGGRRPDNRHHEYENEAQYLGKQEKQMNGSPNYQDPHQNIPNRQNLFPHQQQQVAYRPSDRSSMSSRASSNSNRDMRPQSAYHDVRDAPAQPDFSSRPRSEDVTPQKLQEWQDRYEPNKQDGGHSPPYSNIGAHSRDIPPQPQHNPPPKPTAHQRLFSQQGLSAPQKIDNNAYARQPNFYENTAPLQQEPAPAFHQLQRPTSESELRPRPAPKPSVAPKRNQPRVQQVDMPIMSVDPKRIQPNFFRDGGPPPQASQPQNNYQRMPPQQQGGYQQQPQYEQQQHHPQSPGSLDGSLNNAYNAPNMRNGNMGPQDPYRRNQPDPRQIPDNRDPRMDPRNMPDLRTGPDPRNIPDTRFAPDPRNINDPRNNMVDNIPSPGQGRSPQQPNYMQGKPIPQQPEPPMPNYGYPAEELPPPPMHNDLPNEMPQEYPEELPPLPPPPSQEDLIEKKLAEEQAKLLQHINATNQYLATDPRRAQRYSPNVQQQQQQQPQQQVPNQYQQQQQQQAPEHSQRFNPQHHPTQQQSMNRVLPPNLSETAPMGFEVLSEAYRDNSIPKYQNISFASEVRAASGPDSQVPPPIPQPPSEYESYDNPALKAQGFQPSQPKPPVSSVPSKPRVRDRPSEAGMRSAWDRDAREKAEEEEQEELFRAREQEIADLEAQPYLSPPDQERLRKLKTEHEFQRRVREIAEKGDYDYDDDDDLTERIFTRERLIQSLKEDLEKSRTRIRNLDMAQQRADAAREQERVQMMERRLEMYEKDREEQRERMQKRQERRTKAHQEQLRQQRETRDRQRQNYEEQKRQLMKEEEKMNQRREEELNKRRQFERERRQELQDQRDAEERRLRAEARREDEEYLQQQLARERQQALDQKRPVRVGDEVQRLDKPVNSNYMQYANMADMNNSQPSGLAPSPPERKSSYETFSQHQSRVAGKGPMVPGKPDYPGNMNSSVSMGSLPSALKNVQEPPVPAKKSVSFNTDMNTYKDRTPNQSVSSYKSGSQSSDQGIPPPSYTPSSPEADVFDNSKALSPTGNNSYATSNNTPTVIGAQEVYRDPRSKIEAKIASQSTSKSQQDRMSFKDKMKYFAQEAGEDTVKYKPKASKTLMTIESKLNA